MEFNVINPQGVPSGVSVSVAEGVFSVPYNEPLVHQVVVAYQANARQGTRAQKDRSEVRASTRKPWKQKGGGRARVGAVSSPLWRGGGKIFPNRPDENFSQKINRKMYRTGMCSILSQLCRDSRLLLIEPIVLDMPKTKLIAARLAQLSLSNQSVLLVVANPSENLLLASRNLLGFAILEPHQVDPLSLVHFDKILIDAEGLAVLQEMFG